MEGILHLSISYVLSDLYKKNKTGYLYYVTFNTNAPFYYPISIKSTIPNLTMVGFGFNISLNPVFTPFIESKNNPLNHIVRVLEFTKVIF